MNPNILHVGLDVDDTQYHGSAFNKATGEVIDFRCRPTLKGLLTQLDKLQRHFRGLSIRLCYEASYVGYCLQRDLRAHGVHCDVVAPSSIPSPRGKAVKTDRIDAGHLAQFYANELVTVVQPPDAEQEQDRDLLRTRQKLLLQRAQLRRHMHARANRHTGKASCAARKSPCQLSRRCCAATAYITKPRPASRATGPSPTTPGCNEPSRDLPAACR
jgi:transposase